VGLSPSLGIREGICRMRLPRGDLLVIHLRKCTLGKIETLSHRRVMESLTCG
jgi:hypothetical protein